MVGQCQVSRMLDEEHRANLELLGQLEQALVPARRAAAGHDAALATVLNRFSRHLAHDVGRHFEFEENELFPRMAEAGDGDMAALLTEEHAAIREVAAELQPLLVGAAAGTLSRSGWDALTRTTLEIVERQVTHIQKEAVALLPLLDDLLDETTDRELTFAYRAN